MIIPLLLLLLLLIIIIIIITLLLLLVIIIPKACQWTRFWVNGDWVDGGLGTGYGGKKKEEDAYAHGNISVFSLHFYLRSQRAVKTFMADCQLKDYCNIRKTGNEKIYICAQ